MAGPEIYLDNASTTRPFPETTAAVLEAMVEGYGNPSSRHGLGLAAAKSIERARAALAQLVGVSPGEVVFTGGGSEANNLALKGATWAYPRAGDHLVVTAVEHPSVLEAADWLAAGGRRVTRVPVDRQGLARLEDLLAAITSETVLVSLMHVNNEVGSVQPVAEFGRRLAALRPSSGRRAGMPLLHVDAVQSMCRMPLEPREWGVDLLTVSGHKIHGPKGVGALVVRDGVRLEPLVHGGGHETGRRAGTENVPGIVGFGAALEVWLGFDREEVAGLLSGLRRRLIDIVTHRCPGVVVNGPDSGDTRQGSAPAAASHILSLSFPGIPAEVLQNHLQSRGVYVSIGSACSSRHRWGRSHVLTAMGCPDEVVEGAIRVSLSPRATVSEIETVGEIIAEETARIRGGGGSR